MCSWIGADDPRRSASASIQTNIAIPFGGRRDLFETRLLVASENDRSYARRQQSNFVSAKGQLSSK